jgi:hypothetical protein
MEQLFDGPFRILDPRAVLAIILLCFELLQETETRRSGRVPRSAVLGHAETLLAAMRHLITQRKLCGSFLAPGSRHRSQPSCGSPKARSERKDSPDRQKAGGRDGRFARATKCCSAARWASSPRTPADLSHAIILGPVSVSTNWSSERAARLRRFALLRRHGSIRSNAGSPNPPENGSGEVFIPPSGSSRPIFALSSTGITKIQSPSNGQICRPNLGFS